MRKGLLAVAAILISSPAMAQILGFQPPQPYVIAPNTYRQPQYGVTTTPNVYGHPEYGTTTNGPGIHCRTTPKYGQPGAGFITHCTTS